LPRPVWKIFNIWAHPCGAGTGLSALTKNQIQGGVCATRKLCKQKALRFFVPLLSLARKKKQSRYGVCRKAAITPDLNTTGENKVNHGFAGVPAGNSIDMR
jgi:hypothetical protein